MVIKNNCDSSCYNFTVILYLIQSITALCAMIFGKVYIFRIHASVKENIGLMSSNEALRSNQKDTPIKTRKGRSKI
jgi:hypothetical protein